MGYVFEIIDKNGKLVHLTEERWKHIKSHPFMHNQLEGIKNALTKPLTIRKEEDEGDVLYFYLEFKKNNPAERYLMVAAKYLNGDGFIITAFFTNKVTGEIWKK